jgi:hypothetical protein
MVDNNTSYSVLGDCEFDLPPYMKTLDAFYDDGSHAIISCGIHPSTNELVLLTSEGVLKELNLEAFFLSKKNISDVYPISNGSVLEFISEDMIITVDSEDILSSSKELQLMNLEIGMKHEDKNIDATKDHQGGS